MEHRATTSFRNYLKIKSVHPTPDYDGCVSWIKEQAAILSLPVKIINFPEPAEFAVVLTWKGSNPNLKSIMLNSHMDVVPVDISRWTHDPFAAEKDADGNIWARGSQDMKCVAVQYLEAIRCLIEKGFVPKRDVHITFVTDEELGGKRGMAAFVNVKEFEELNVGLELDEGGAHPLEYFQIFNGERSLWQIKFTVKGNTGHALMFIENTAAEKLQKLINRFLQLRQSEKVRLEAKSKELTLGDVTTVNMTMIQGGMQANVVPTELSVTFDIRVTPHWPQAMAEKLIDDICKEAGEGVSYEFISKSDVLPPTSIKDENIWWKALSTACKDMNMKMKVVTCPGATDARFLRAKGIAAFGFSPMNHTPVLLHDNDEFLNEKIFLKGIDIYETVIQRLASIEAD